MTSRKPIKKRAPKALVLKLLGEGRITFSGHCLDQMKERKIGQAEVFRVLSRGKREAERDQLKGNEFTYAFRGYDHANERWIRVAVGIPRDDEAVVVTAIDLG